MEFKKRLTAPSTTDKNWTHYTKGGLNKCILIEGNSCLPNCVGYAWGRWYELLGKEPKLSRGNAENWYGHNDGCKRGSTPKLGAVICWRKGQAGNEADGAGHVAIVEEIKSDGSIVTSNSGYKSTRFYTKTVKAPNYYIGSAYAFQGFIYLPIEFDEPKKQETTTKFKIGDKVIINGNLYVNSNAKSPSGIIKNKTTKITRIAEGTKHPYNTTGDLGWMDGSDIKLVSDGTTYVVKQGDTLSGIAQKYNTTWEKIYKDNKEVIGENPNIIHVGQVLTIK